MSISVPLVQAVLHPILIIAPNDLATRLAGLRLIPLTGYICFLFGSTRLGVDVC